MYEVTIAIPLYNAEKYIAQTMEAAFKQTFSSIEYLIIDDKGTDSSIDIIEGFKRNHARGKDIRVVAHKQNSGVAATRNTILKECKSKYLFFLDSDDLITPDCIEKLYNASEKENAEVTYGSYREEWDNNKMPGVDFILPNLTFKKENELATFANRSLRQTLRSFVWNILYNVHFLKNTGASFQPVKVWEDLLFYYDVIPLVKRAVFLPDITYIYIKREGSLSQYNHRTTIPLKEMLEHIQIREYCKEKCKDLVDKPYFGNLVTKTMKICIDTARIAVYKRKMFVPQLPTSEIKKLLRHPLGLSRIMKLKEYKLFNLSVYILGKSPSWLSINLLSFYSWGYKTYKNKRIP